MNIGNITSDNFNLDSNGKDIQIEVYEQLIEQLQQENKILKENAEHNDKVVDKVNWENQLLKKENQELKEKLDKYENPEDMTLFAMWCTEKVKDENKQLKNNWDELKEWLEEKWEVSQDIWFVKIINKMKGLENGDSND